MIGIVLFYIKMCFIVRHDRYQFDANIYNFITKVRDMRKNLVQANHLIGPV